ncbi:MAG: zinc-finger domain-containing protein [Pseudomonadota bacterium]
MSIQVPETEIVETRRVCCDGGEGALGHPRVWLSIAPEIGYVDCGYCDKRFILKGYEDKVPDT